MSAGAGAGPVTDRSTGPDGRIGSAGGAPSGAGPHRRVPFRIAALLAAITAAVLLALALLADRAGPLEAHPPTVSVRPPPPVTMQTLPTPTALSSAPPQQEVEVDGSWLWIVLAVIGGLLLILAVVLLIRALRRPGRIAAPPLAAGSAALAPAVLGWLDEDEHADDTDARSFDPRRAADEIIAAWAALESAAAAAGHRRRPASTPTEFLESLIDWFPGPGSRGDRGGDGMPGRSADGGGGMAGLSPAEASATLLRLYHRARFDTSALAPGAAVRARAAARTLGALLLRSAGPTAAPGRETSQPAGARLGEPAAGPGGSADNLGDTGPFGTDTGPAGPDVPPGRGGRHR